MADATALAAVWPRPQIEASRITSARSASTSRSFPFAAPGREPLQRLLLADRADAAGHALPARLVAEELGDADHGVDEVGRLVVDDHDAGAERRAGGARVLERERQVELVGPQERAGGAAEQDRLRRRGAREVEQVAEREAERHLVEARPLDVAGEAEEPRAGRVGRPDRRERGAALVHDVEHVEERLDVVHDRRLAEEADLDRERRLVARLAAVALDRLEERRLLAADVRARADAQLDVEREARAHDVVAEQAVLARLRERVLEPRVRERVLRAHVDEAVLAAGRVRGDRHRLDERERVALHQDAVLERPRLRLVGVADEVVRLRRLLRDGLPLRAGRERGAAAAEQLRLRRPRAATPSGRARARAAARRSRRGAVRVERLRIDACADAAQEPQAGLARLRQRRAGLGQLELARLRPGDRAQRRRRALAEAEARRRVRAVRHLARPRAGTRGRCRRAARRRDAPRARAARRSSRRRTRRRAERRAGATRSRARPRSPSRRAAAPRAARGGAGGGASVGARDAVAVVGVPAPTTASIASRSASVGSAARRRRSTTRTPGGSPSP